MSHFKKKLAAFGAMLAFLSVTGTAAFASGSYLNGQATVLNSAGANFAESADKTRLDVNVNNKNNNVNGENNGAVAQVDWGVLGNKAGQTINFGFTGLSQTIINRVLGGTKSQFYGMLTNSCAGGNCTSYAETGKVVIINPAGILFGAGSQVDINSLTATTYDVTGAKNLNNLGGQTAEAYLNSFRGGQSQDSNGNVYNYNRTLNYNSRNIAQFVAAGISLADIAGKGLVELNGTTMTHNGAINTNKSVNIISDNILYKDSVIRTGDNLNYLNTDSYGRVNLVTADGVNFVYLANGYGDNYSATDNGAVAKTINIDNSGLGATEQAIRSGNVRIHNKGTAEGSSIKIKNSIIKATKLVNKENGDIYIRGSKDVEVDHSRLETTNTTAGTAATKAQNGGEVFVAGGDVTIKNGTLLYSAGANASAENADNAGSVRVYAYDGDATINDSRIVSKGNVEVIATDNVNMTGSMAQAKNTVASAIKKNISVEASDINLKNTTLDATGNMNITATNAANQAIGSIKIGADNYGDSLIIAQGNLSIEALNTELDKTALAYTNLKFYGDKATSGLNTVTIKNGTTFSQKDSAGGIGNVNTIETNGDLILDNTKLQRAGVNLSFDRNADNSLKDDKTIDGITYHTTATALNTGVLTVKSTEGNVIAKNGTDVTATQSIEVDSAKQNVSLNDSKFTSGDVFVHATEGTVQITNNSELTSTVDDVTVAAKNNVVFGEKGAAGVTIDKTTKITAKGQVTISSKGDINAEKTTMPTIKYGDTLTFNAGGSNNFTSEDSLKSVNVKYIAGTANNITTKGDMQFVNSTLRSKENNLETIENGNVIMNNLNIQSATVNAKDTKTTIKAKGTVTTDDVTGTLAAHTNEAEHTYPMDVTYGTATNAPSALDINRTKLVINTKVDGKTPKNDSTGSINLTLKNATNPDAGIELTAENTVYDNQIGPNEGPEVHLHTVDDKVAISKIVTDKLFLDSKDQFIAAPVEGVDLSKFPAGAQPKGYLEVRDYGGFNMDNDFTITDPADFDYTGHSDPGKYGDIDVNHRHTIEFDPNDPTSDFLLVYDRPAEAQPAPAPIIPMAKTLLPDTNIQLVRIPLQSVEISKNSKVADNTVDQTSNIMSAAAKVELADEADADDDEDEYLDIDD